MTSGFFAHLLHETLDDFSKILECWKRRFRDMQAKEWEGFLSAKTISEGGKSRFIICFNHPTADWEDRIKLAAILNSLFEDFAYLYLKKLTPEKSILEISRVTPGCEMEIEILKPELLNGLPPPQEQELFKLLWDAGKAVGKVFFDKNKSVLFTLPLIALPYPQTYLPGVWVRLSPGPGCRFFTDDIRVIEADAKAFLGREKFRSQGLSFASAVKENDDAWVLVDYKERGDKCSAET